MATETAGGKNPGQVTVQADGGSVVYRLSREHHVVAGARPSGAPVLLASEEDSLFVVSGQSGDAADAKWPVYRLEPSGQVALPTGRVFVQAAGGSESERLREPIAAKGFRIVSVPGYARHAAWLEPTTGGVGFALRHFGDLLNVEGIVSSTPQMLLAAARR